MPQSSSPFISYVLYIIYMFLSILGSNCFFLDTTPSKKALLFSNFLSNAFSTTSTLSPNAIISELLFKISVIASTNMFKPFSLISSLDF